MAPRLSLKDLPETDQPRYRAEHLGLGALTNAELLQIVANVNYLDICPTLLHQAGSLSALERMSLRDVSEVDGLGQVAAVRIKAAFELGRRLACERTPESSRITSPGDAAHLLMARFGNESREHFVIVSLNTKNHIVAIDELYHGTVNTIPVRAAEVFQVAVKRGAVSIILCHNHPAGDPTPSPEDVHLTASLVQAGRLMDVDVIDHIVVTQDRFVSLRERGLGF